MSYRLLDTPKRHSPFYPHTSLPPSSPHIYQSNIYTITHYSKIFLLTHHLLHSFFFFFLNDPATTKISPLPLHDLLPIYQAPPQPGKKSVKMNLAALNDDKAFANDGHFAFIKKTEGRRPFFSGRASDKAAPPPFRK